MQNFRRISRNIYGDHMYVDPTCYPSKSCEFWQTSHFIDCGEEEEKKSCYFLTPESLQISLIHFHLLSKDLDTSEMSVVEPNLPNPADLLWKEKHWNEHSKHGLNVKDYCRFKISFRPEEKKIILSQILPVEFSKVLLNFLSKRL